MKFQCERYLLDDAVSIASRAAASKSPNPSLEGLLIEASVAGGIRITGFDLRKGIYTDIDADVSEAGSVVLIAKIFSDIVHKLPDGIVTIDTAPNLNTHISCGKAEYDIMGLDATDYPEIPDMEDHTTDIVIKQEMFGQMIRETSFSVANVEIRPIYTGELIEVEQGRMTMVALDGYRMAVRREDVVSCSAESCSVVVPGNALSDVEKLCTAVDGEVRISIGVNHICFRLNKTTILSRKLEGEFLNYKKTLPTEFAISLKADRLSVISCADRVSLMIDSQTKNPLRCRFGNGNLNITSINATGRAEDNCFYEGDGKDTVIGLNHSFLLQALKAAPADNILINLNNGTSPCVILPEDENDSFAYMILPVRLRSEE